MYKTLSFTSSFSLNPFILEYHSTTATSAFISWSFLVYFSSIYVFYGLLDYNKIQDGCSIMVDLEGIHGRQKVSHLDKVTKY